MVGDGTSAETLEILQQRVKRQENLLQRCKETIQSHKEQCTLLTSEKEALQEQLDERLQELEKMKVKEQMSVVECTPVKLGPPAPAWPAPLESLSPSSIDSVARPPSTLGFVTLSIL